MALLQLKDIGKIYVSEGSVAVGIRGVNLSFEKGEFVAVTGKSGSGKSTLLNVISGMDSYEEGELYIEGQPTSHYLQPEWEEYREKYISFIFQDYNIIESFTVLQNVELSLMHIEDKKERRERAVELLKRVGLSSHLNHKGSKLSGGQKQRTVIARALAKDSPIILADEPTGNLDSETSKEIIELLREVSKDKLLIVVTHNFEQLESVATRHIRVFDGSVESDHYIGVAQSSNIKGTNEAPTIVKSNKKIKFDFKNGVTLGKTIFFAKPRLSTFLCLLMVIGMLGIFMMTTLCGQASEMFEKNYMFTPIDGRVVLANHSGTPLTDDELQAICDKYGALSYLHYDVLLDKGYSAGFNVPIGDGFYDYVFCEYTYGETFGDDIVGRYPESADEVFLYLPIEWQTLFGKENLQVTSIDAFLYNSFTLKVSGVKYYYDNNKEPKCLFTEDGFKTMTALYYFSNGVSFDVSISGAKGWTVGTFTINDIYPSFEIPDGKIYIDSTGYENAFKANGGDKSTSTTVSFQSVYNKYNYYYDGEKSNTVTFSREFTNDEISHVMPPDVPRGVNQRVIVSDEIIRDMAQKVLCDSYKQASVFFANDKEARNASELLQSEGYIAIPSETTYSGDAEDAIFKVVTSFFFGAVWFLSIMFLSFFINLCSGRALGAFKGDMAIMRSMGICVSAIKIGMYFRMLLSLIPAFILMIVSAICIFRSPVMNPYFVYLYWWQYALIVLGMILLVLRTTQKQIHKLFSESVKKSLKGGNAE